MANLEVSRSFEVSSGIEVMRAVSTGFGFQKGELVAVKQVCSGGQLLYRMPLFKVYDHEQNLNAGRFVDFVGEPQEHRIRFEAKPRAAIWFANLEFENLCHLLGQMATWIAENNRGLPWSIGVELHDVHNADVSMSFADLTVAVVFKLAWL